MVDNATSDGCIRSLHWKPLRDFFYRAVVQVSAVLSVVATSGDEPVRRGRATLPALCSGQNGRSPLPGGSCDALSRAASLRDQLARLLSASFPGALQPAAPIDLELFDGTFRVPWVKPVDGADSPLLLLGERATLTGPVCAERSPRQPNLRLVSSPARTVGERL